MGIDTESNAFLGVSPTNTHFYVLIYYGALVTYSFIWSHSEEIGHEGGEAWRQATLSNKSQLEFC